ncbi:MAG TPA: hypothetical protein VGC56_11975 [Allosphingosinicella sp.]|jgi:hypothetical protein
MALQGENLAMVGLGVLGDQPPHPIQPVLPNGVHLRWAFDPELGFPWHGYHLFRRPHRPGKPICIAQQWRTWAQEPPAALTQSLAEGEISSDSQFSLASAPGGVAGIDLRHRTFLRFDLPKARPARSFQLRIGFPADKPLRDSDTVPDREDRASGLRVPPAPVLDRIVPDPNDRKAGPRTRAAPVLEQIPPDLKDGEAEPRTRRAPDVEQVEAAISHNPFASPRAVAFDRDTPVAFADLAPGAAPTAFVTLAADRMDRIEISGGWAVLTDLCFVPVDQDAGEGWGQIPGFPYPLCLPTAAPGYACKGHPTTDAQAESMALSRIRYGAPAPWSGTRITQLRQVLDSLAANPPSAGGQEMAERSGSYHDSLGDPDQPVMPDQRPLDLVLMGAINPAIAQMVGLYWIDDSPRAGPGSASAASDPRPIAAAREEPRLVRADAAPVADEQPRRAGSRVSTLAAEAGQLAAGLPRGGPAPTPEFFTAPAPLPPPSPPYDYLLLADHSGRYHGEPAEALVALAQPLPDDVDVWICFNLREQKASPLPPPQEVAVFALPGGATDPAVIAQDLVSAAGLRWRIEQTAEGDLLPGAAVGYHIWRAQLGPAAPAAPPPLSTHAHLTASGMVMVAAPSPAPGGQARPSDWPPWPMHKIDGRLAEGWYSYLVSGMDIFGRIGIMSAPAEWRQWAPEPVPRPWYYSGIPSDAHIHPFAVRLLVKAPPPVVPGVEASTLDPLDPDLAGEARYDSWKAQGWWNALSAADKRKRAGVRVRWRWDPEQMAQAPRTKEFRIYLSSGGEPVADHNDPLAWPQRVYAIDAATHFTPVLGSNLVPTGGRQYEVLLPENAAGQGFAGVALEPTDLEPIVYAHVAVTAADDRTHSADPPKWSAGAWGGRFGNEGRIGNAAKIFRVLRAPPPMPPVIGADDKVWATRADYHGVSRYTVHWAKPAPGQKVHIFRALDDAVFRADWDRRHAGGAAAFQTADAAPFGWNPAEEAAVVAELGAPLDSVAPLSWDDDPAVRAAYEALSERALRVLASFSGNDDAFVQTTFEPLDPADPANADRPGPDPNAPYTSNFAWGAYVAEIDGKAANRYFFRAAYVNAAHIVGALGPSSPAVYLPKVAPPRVPAITKVTSGELSITLEWAHNREPDLAEYRVYRAEDERQARDPRLMARVATIAKADVDMTKPGVVWTDTGGLIGGRTYLYCLTSVDGVANESALGPAAGAMAVDGRIPDVPVWEGQRWQLMEPQDGTTSPWPADGILQPGLVPALELTWSITREVERFELERRRAGTGPFDRMPTQAGIVEESGTFRFVDTSADPRFSWEYVVRAQAGSGLQSARSLPLRVSRPRLGGGQ